MTDWEVLYKYISEHGQQFGTVSWQMARDSLKALRYEHEVAKPICQEKIGSHATAFENKFHA